MVYICGRNLTHECPKVSETAEVYVINLTLHASQHSLFIQKYTFTFK